MAVLDITDVNNAVGKLQAQFADKKVIYIKTDVCDKQNIMSSFRQAREAFGKIDVVIGNAGIFNEKQPEKTIMVNLVGFEELSRNCRYT